MKSGVIVFIGLQLVNNVAIQYTNYIQQKEILT